MTPTLAEMDAALKEHRPPVEPMAIVHEWAGKLIASRSPLGELPSAADEIQAEKNSAAQIRDLAAQAAATWIRRSGADVPLEDATSWFASQIAFDVCRAAFAQWSIDRAVLGFLQESAAVVPLLDASKRGKSG